MVLKYTSGLANMPVGRFRAANVRLYGSYGSYRRWVARKSNPKENFHILTHKEWVELAREQVALRRMRRADKLVRSGFVDGLRQFAPVGLGYVPTWKQIAIPKHISIKTGRGDVRFTKPTVTQMPSLRPGAHFVTDRQRQVEQYRSDKYWFNFKKTWDDSFPVGFYSGVLTTVERVSDGLCLTCGSHRLDGFWCCFRFCSRQLLLISDSVRFLHALARSDVVSFRTRLSFLVKEAYRLVLQQHRIAWHVSLGFLPYFTKFSRAFSLSQDLANVSLSLAGQEPVEKVTKGTVVKELAAVTMPTVFEVTERLFSVEVQVHFVFGTTGWAVVNEAFLALLSTLRVVADFRNDEEALVFYVQQKFKGKTYSRWQHRINTFLCSGSPEGWGFGSLSSGSYLGRTTGCSFFYSNDIGRTFLEHFGVLSDSYRMPSYKELLNKDYTGFGDTFKSQGSVREPPKIPRTTIRHSTKKFWFFGLGNRTCLGCKETFNLNVVVHVCSDFRTFNLDLASETWVCHVYD